MGLLEHKKLLVFCALAAAARLLQPAYVPPVPCTYAEKKLGCVPNRIPMASTWLAETPTAGEESCEDSSAA